MPRQLSPEEARKMAAARKAHRGPAKVPRPCPKCGVQCGSARAAQGHCA